MKRFVDQVGMITLSETSICGACALRFAEEEAHVLCLDLDEEGLRYVGKILAAFRGEGG